MSGYLARLVASIGSGRSAIHPLVASRFATPAEPAELPVIEEEPITSPRLQPEVGAAPAELRPPGVVRSANSPVVLRAAQRHPEEPHAPLTPMRPHLEPASPASGETAQRAQRAGEPPAPTSYADGEIPAAGPYTPLFIVDTAHRAAPPAPAPLQLRQRPISAAGQTARPAREPDEVHIHIGRIEVIAAAPSPPIGPPVKPARKSPSLDEYLNRGRR